MRRVPSLDPVRLDVDTLLLAPWERVGLGAEPAFLPALARGVDGARVVTVAVTACSALGVDR